MPNDATHRIINYLMLSIFIVANFYFNIEHDFGIIIIFMITYVLGTELFSPDLDIRSKPAKRLGILSYPIRKLSKHRGMGHSLLFGWLLKFLYICTIISILLFLADKLGYDFYWLLIYINEEMILSSLAGLLLSNAVHIVADKIF
jgi:uncharacterized metal-binding protein